MQSQAVGGTSSACLCKGVRSRVFGIVVAIVAATVSEEAVSSATFAVVIFTLACAIVAGTTSASVSVVADPSRSASVAVVLAAVAVTDPALFTICPLLSATHVRG